MELQRALKLRVGETVHCPTDRGDPAYAGVVSYISGNIATHLGKEFIWVTVKDRHGCKRVWPSNRLG
jgi:hypothetical protein